MDEPSLPALPHLPVVDEWRVHTMSFGVPDSDRLQALCMAMSLYEDSFTRYLEIAEDYERLVDSTADPGSADSRKQLCRTYDLAIEVHTRAVTDYQRLASAYGMWTAHNCSPPPTADAEKLEATPERGGNSSLSLQPQQ